jgi:BirA family transcriptional regulator, biotin operon repressor / biotin---[acetyl-CoA-carboxylase] ligase
MTIPRFLHFPCVTSTHDEAFAAVLRDETGPLWIVADEQTKGRGRRGKIWHSPPGNLHTSLLLLDPCSQALVSQLGFVAGLALVKALEEAIPLRHCEHYARNDAERFTVPYRLKWPNDVLLGSRKLAGLLVESRFLNSRLAVAIGFGVNLHPVPERFESEATHLEQKFPEGRDALLERLVHRFSETFATWQEQGFAAIRATWLDRAAFLSETVRLETPSGPVEGVFTGIDATGRLQLRTMHGLEHHDSGEVSLRPVPEQAGPTTLGTA